VHGAVSDAVGMDGDVIEAPPPHRMAAVQQLAGQDDAF
jgi:hypothetical protein